MFTHQIRKWLSEMPNRMLQANSIQISQMPGVLVHDLIKLNKIPFSGGCRDQPKSVLAAVWQWQISAITQSYQLHFAFITLCTHYRLSDIKKHLSTQTQPNSSFSSAIS